MQSDTVCSNCLKFQKLSLLNVMLRHWVSISWRIEESCRLHLEP
jgi:hypothetical protein